MSTKFYLLLVSNLLYVMTDVDYVSDAPWGFLDLGSQIHTSHCNHLHSIMQHMLQQLHTTQIHHKRITTS